MNKSSLPGKPISVLHVVHWPQSGITSFLKNLVEYSDGSCFNHGIAFFVADNNEMASFEAICQPVVDLEFSKNPVLGVQRLRRLIHTLDPDFIHTHSFQPGLWVRLIEGSRSNRIVSTMHSIYPYFQERGLLARTKAKLETVSINRANRKLVCISQAVSTHIKKNTNVREELLEVIPNGVLPVPGDPGTTRDRVRNELGIEENTTALLVVSRLSQEKGVDILLRAFRILLDFSPDFRLIVVGAGAEERTLKNLARELSIVDSVHFAGFQSEVLPYYMGADIYVAPSRFEGLGMSVLEAMRSGLPVVATDVGGHPEIVQDGKSGILTPSEDADTIAAAILRIQDMPDLGQEMGEIGKEFCRKGFDIERVVEEYQQLYGAVKRATGPK